MMSKKHYNPDKNTFGQTCFNQEAQPELSWVTQEQRREALRRIADMIETTRKELEK